MESNDKAGISPAQPTDLLERAGIARQCCSSLEITMPMVVDEMNDRVGHAYSGMPDRLYLLDKEGKVVYKGGRGPFGFKVGELEQSIILHLVDQPAPIRSVSMKALAHERSPLLSDDEAWQRLPALEKGVRQPLPTWARTLAATMPRTTAAMIELDALHRDRSPLPPALRGKLRWVAAHANRCAYSEAVALADLRRNGLSEAELGALCRDWSAFAEVDRAALTFAQKMTVAASTVTDAEMERLRHMYGDWQVVAMVQLLAHANFQDRLFLTLGQPLEPESASRPLDVRFARDPSVNQHVRAPERKPMPAPSAAASNQVADSDWLSRTMPQLQDAMEQQRGREARIRVPTWEEVKAGLPAGYPADRPLRIKWSLVCLGYQPELAAAWSACTRAFAEEAKQDRVFEESLFWVVTRTLDCFY